MTVPGGGQRTHAGLIVHRDRLAPGEIQRVGDVRVTGNGSLAGVLSLADARAGSPMETRLRLVLRLAGLPAPAVQHVVADERTRTAVWLDLAYPEHLIGIEYEGADHARADQVLRDVGRYTKLVDEGWRIYRYTKYDVYGEPGGSSRRSLEHSDVA